MLGGLARLRARARVWKQIRDDLVDLTNGLAQGDVTDLSNFMGAVIDERAFAKHKDAIDRAHATSGIDVLAGGTYDDSVGYFVRPTVLEISDADRRVVPHRVLRADPVGPRLPGRRTTTGRWTRWSASRPTA